MTRRFLLVGLTGGLATGKSTVSEILRRLGCVILDADLLAREVVEPGESAFAAIAEEFGPDVVGADGRLDRKRLGAIVFANPERRLRLEAITHPAIRDRFLARLAALEAEGFEGLVVWDAPVMIEAGGYKNMDRLVVVITDDATQRARALSRDGDREDVARKIASQMPLAEKAALADYVIDNSGDRAATEARTGDVHAALLAEGRLSSRLLSKAASRQTRRLGVAFPINMGNRGQNEIRPSVLYARLRAAVHGAEFLAYHWRRSGNFLFLDAGAEAEARAIQAVTAASSLSCVARGFPALAHIDWHVPTSAATTKGGSVVLNDVSGVWRVVAVLLSESVAPAAQWTGALTDRIRVLSWPSARDVLCAYERPGEAGDVGQVTRAILAKLVDAGTVPTLAGSGRTLGVIRDIIQGRGLRSSERVRARSGKISEVRPKRP